MSERRFALIRVASGDYLLPSNDGSQLWRFTQYVEDGSAEISDGHGGWRALRGTFWNAFTYGGDVERALLDDELLEWEHWHLQATTLDTRRDAIEYALEHPRMSTTYRNVATR